MKTQSRAKTTHNSLSRVQTKQYQKNSIPLPCFVFASKKRHLRSISRTSTILSKMISNVLIYIYFGKFTYFKIYILVCMLFLVGPHSIYNFLDDKIAHIHKFSCGNTFTTKLEFEFEF